MFSVHNTLSGKTEEFKPIRGGEVGMYHCGPTVYDYAHIGNLRSYVFADILRRTAEYGGLKVRQVVNITDIGHLSSDADSGDDKMVKGLKREGLPLSLEGLKQLADKYEQAFKDDLKILNIETPHHFPRATEYLKQEIELVQKLEEKGYAYKLDDGIYFDTGKLQDYGRLGGLTPLDESKARVGSEGKKSPRDFVLWKLSREDRLGFPSPWGMGFPGWHIECSTMSRELLGQPFDIHTGGIDHIPVHHNNEIAQSEASYDTPLANYWMHNEFVTLSGEKIAKSAGSFFTLKDIKEKGFSPLAYRYLLLLSHYRTPTNFSWEALEAAQNAYKRLRMNVSTMPSEDGSTNMNYKKEFLKAIEGDLNTPEALAVVWKLLGDGDIRLADKRQTILDFDKVLGLNLHEIELPSAEIVELKKKRDIARKNKDFAESDKIRDELFKKQWGVIDTEDMTALYWIDNQEGSN
ncbi:cysteine--tRNA ligase [Candidatus Parcubacteria bacterium]|nr:cysteine--tRNA ligase [Candidatus Parcubacteria bacterium]